MSIAALGSGPPALPPTLRRPAAVAVLLSLAVFGLLATRYAGQSAPGRVDDRSQSLVDGSFVGAARAARALIDLGDPLTVVVGAFLLAGMCLWVGHRRLALVAVVGPGLTGTVTTLTKPLIGRTLEGDFAYPSGHTGGATALGLTLALLVVGLLRPRRAVAAALVALGAVLGGGGMAVLLVAGDVHYPTDTVGGFCVAVAMVLGSALVVEAAAARTGVRRRSRP